MKDGIIGPHTSRHTSRENQLDTRAHARRVALQVIRPGNPVENAYVESFNGRLRDECLNGYWFLSLADARRQIAAWRAEYNGARPHGNLAGRTPDEFAREHERLRLVPTTTRLSA